MELKKNDIVPLDIETVTVQGSGLGRYNSLAVFVPMTAAGDKIDAHILKVKSNCAFAKVEKIREESPDRIPPDCPAYAKCGGCVFRHMTYEAEAKLKEQFVHDVIKRIGKSQPEWEPIIAAPGRNAYRNKAQFPVARDENGLKIGFFSAHSHRVTECRACPLQPSEFEAILNAFDKYITENGVSVYDEIAHRGLLRHIYIRKAEMTGEIMACAVINGKKLPNEQKLVETVRAACPQIASVVVNINTEKTNVILGKSCRTLWGADCITDVLCGLKFRISPLSFYQVNRSQAEKLYRKAAEYAAPSGDETILDLYCGAGTIGLTMAANAKRIIGVEVVPEAIEDAKINARLNSVDNAEFICGDAAKAAEELKARGVKPDTVILDPPRKGCEKALLETVAEMAPERVVYISCDPATQARDVEIFASLGYTAKKACPVDMFPGTGHVESVVLLSQQKPKFTVDVNIDLDELDATSAETKATYDEIKAYVLKKYGLKVSHLYIAQVKQKYGIIERENYNKPKNPKAKQPQCPPEKVKAITEALKYFRMI